MQPTYFFAVTDLIVIDVDPEMADYSNPRGEIHGHAAYVYAEDGSGNRARIYVATSRREADCLLRAERMAMALNVRLRSGRLPVGFNRWEVSRPAYGSEAYVAYGAQDDIEWERSMEMEQ